MEEMCTICGDERQSKHNYSQFVKNLRLDYILQDYPSLHETWKILQGIVYYREYRGIGGKSRAVFELTSALENSILPPDSTDHPVGVITSVKKSVTPIKKAVSPVKKSVTPVMKALTPVKQNNTPVKQNNTPVKQNNTPVKQNNTPVKEVSNSVKKSSITSKVNQSRVLKEDVPPSTLNTSRRMTSRTRAALDPSASARVHQDSSKLFKETQSAASRLYGTPPYNFKRTRRGSLPTPTAASQRLMEEQEDDPEDASGEEDIREDASGYEVTRPSLSPSKDRPKRTRGRKRNPDFDIPQALQNTSSQERSFSPVQTPPLYKSTAPLISDNKRALNISNSAGGTTAVGTNAGTAVGAPAVVATTSSKRKSFIEDHSSLELSSKRNRNH